MNDSNAVRFTVTSQPLPVSWLDQDVGVVGQAGSAGYANGTFTVAGAGQGTFFTSADGFHFAYQSLTGDGTMVARVVSLQGSAAQAGIMVRETLNAGANHVYVFDYSSTIYMTERTSTGASSSYQSLGSGALPYWIKLARSGNVFTMYSSADGVNWLQLGTSQTVSMAQNAYVGLAVSSRTTSALATATFDSVSLSSAAAPAPVITAVSATTGSIGSQVVISGTGFGALQGGSAVLLNGAAVTVNTWSGTSISITIPVGATTGSLLVTIAPSMNDSNAVRFTVTSQPLPVSWLDQDVGVVGLAGSAGYANGTFTVAGAGQGTFFTSADGFHFAYQSLTGDGTMVARVVSLQGSAAQAGIMVRETLNPGANHVYLFDYSSTLYMTERTSTGASSSYQSLGSGALPYWIKLARSGNVFTMYSSADGVNWLQLGTSQTVSMAQNAYVGLAVSSRTTSALATATFDSVSLSSAAAPAPVITAVSATTGSIGSQVVISGTGFGALQGGSAVLLNGAAVTVNTWSGTSISITIPVGATTGSLLVTIAPSMNDSNAVRFTVTAQPLPVSWLDQDVGLVGQAGSAGYANGTFTVAGAGQGTFFTSADGFHFAYQSLTGDGTMVARVVSLQGSAAQAGIMVRETLNAGANHGYVFDYSSTIYMTERTSTGASRCYQSLGSGALPYWIKLARSGNVFTMYSSADGVNWLQLGTSQTVSIAQNAYVGLAVSSRTTSALASATFDSVSLSSAAAPAPVITAVSATTGSIGSQVVISGTGFGALQGGSAVLLNGAAVTVNTWSGTSISITIPVGATTGSLLVTIAPSMNDSNAVRFTVTAQPLPVSWLDQDVGVVGQAGSAGYANGTFTVAGAGQGTFFTSADGFHFVYQSLTGDGTMVARVVSLQGSAAQAGIMVRETLNAGANHVYVFDYSSTIYMTARTSTGASRCYQSLGSGALPYWIKLARSGNVFTMYSSADGVNWLQLGTSQTVSIAQNAYVGLAVSSRTTSALASATFDSVSLSSAAAPVP